MQSSSEFLCLQERISVVYVLLTHWRTMTWSFASDLNDSLSGWAVWLDVWMESLSTGRCTSCLMGNSETMDKLIVLLLGTSVPPRPRGLLKLLELLWCCYFHWLRPPGCWNRHNYVQAIKVVAQSLIIVSDGENAHRLKEEPQELSSASLCIFLACEKCCAVTLCLLLVVQMVPGLKIDWRSFMWHNPQ